MVKITNTTGIIPTPHTRRLYRDQYDRAKAIIEQNEFRSYQELLRVAEILAVLEQIIYGIY